MFAAAWEAYKEIAAVLGVVALLMAVWRRRRIAIFARIVVVGHLGMVLVVAKVLREKWAEWGKWERVRLMPLLVAYIAFRALIALPKIFAWEKEILRAAVGGYRTVENATEVAKRWADDVRYGSDVRRWWWDDEDDDDSDDRTVA